MVICFACTGLKVELEQDILQKRIKQELYADVKHTQMLN